MFFELGLLWGTARPPLPDSTTLLNRVLVLIHYSRRTILTDSCCCRCCCCCLVGNFLFWQTDFTKE